MSRFPVISLRSGRILLGLTVLLPVVRADEPAYQLPDFATYSAQVANQTPVATFAMPVSGLRFEPRVDVQARNLPEAQADVTIRGGVFENTGFKVGALSLYDPQTGHYFAEIPVAPAMLQSPKVLTGADNALSGFNAGVGTVAYGWRPIEQRGEASVAAGDYATNRQSFYQGYAAPVGGSGGLTLGADVELSRSESDGSVPFGDHNFKRAAARVQLRGPGSQTDIFAGTQAKFFGWPDLYTPFGVDETEDLHTQLYIINHRQWTSPDNYWEVGAYSRRNYDDYEFNRFIPGEFNPYQHTTYVQSAAVDGHAAFDTFAVSYSAQAKRDSLESTALVFGRFHTRDYLKLSAVPEVRVPTSAGELKLSAGATYDETNRDGSAVSPVVTAALTQPDGTRFYAEYAESTQVPTYTALNSSPTGGLFRGNPNLGRETSRNLETGADFKSGGWTVEGAVFYRWDDHLVDWTYSLASSAARTANAVNTGTFGLQVVATHKTKLCDLVLGYTYLDKTADYGGAAVDASFYALNFAKQRLTAAVTARLGYGFEVRMDNEFRVQEKNLLRTTGGNSAVRSSLGLYYLPPAIRGLELSALVGNLWDSGFQDVPSVPAARRQFSVGAAYRW
jgi:vitamin B12 transporter